MNSVLGAVKRVFGGVSSVQTEVLRKWNIAAAVILGAQALALLLFSANYTVPVYWLFVTGDSLQSKLQGTPVLAPAVHELMQINLAYVMAATLGLSALGYALLATIWRGRYETALKHSWQPLRWVMVAIGLMGALTTVGLLVGVRSVDGLRAEVVLAVITSLAGAQLELRYSERKNRVVVRDWLVLAIGILAPVAAWLMIVAALLGTVLYGSASVPGYVWWLAATLFVGSVLYVASLHLSFTRYDRWAEYAFGELCTSVLFVAIETAVAWQLFAAVLRP